MLLYKLTYHIFLQSSSIQLNNSFRTGMKNMDSKPENTNMLQLLQQEIQLIKTCKISLTICPYWMYLQHQRSVFQLTNQIAHLSEQEADASLTTCLNKIGKPPTTCKTGTVSFIKFKIVACRVFNRNDVNYRQILLQKYRNET